MEETERTYLIRRLDGIDSQLNTLTDAMIQIARSEERLVNHGQALDRLGARVDSHSNRIRCLENATGKAVTGWVEKVGLICVAAGVSGFVAWLQ